MDEAKPRNMTPTRKGVIIGSERHHVAYLTTILKEVGLAVKTYENVPQALSVLNPHEPPAVIISDFRLSKSAGQRFSQRLSPQEYKAFPQTFILIVSPLRVAGGIAWRIVCELGAEVRLSEPMDTHRLKQLISTHLESTAATPPPVLLVSHDDHMRGRLRRAFKTRGEHVICASTNDSALALIEQQVPGVVIVDGAFAGNAFILHAIRDRCPAAVIFVWEDPVLNDQTIRLPRKNALVLTSPLQDTVPLSARAQEGAAVRALSRCVDHGHTVRHARAASAVRREKDVFQIIGHPSMIIDPEYRILAANRATLQAFGYSEEHLRGGKCYALMHGSAEPPRGCPLQKLLASGKMEVEAMQVEILGRVFLVSCTPMHDDQGGLTSIFHLATDITERTLAEQATLQAQSRAQSYLDVAEVILIVLNTRGEVDLINRKGCLLLGYAEEELIGRDWFASCLCARDRLVVRADFKRIIAEEIEPLEYYENYVVTKTGEERLIAWHNALLRNDAGVVLGTVSSGEDITDRRRAEEQLKQSEEKYRQIFAQASEGIFQTTPEGQYISMNPAFARMFGYASPEEMSAAIHDIGQQLYVHPEERENLKHILARDDHVEGFEAEFYRKDGARIWISINVHNVRDADGRIRYYEGTNVDITARKKNEMALKAVLEGTIAFVGREYFPSLVRELAAVLGVRYAFVGELVPGQPGYIRSVAFEADGKAYAQERSALLSHTPSETVLAKGLCAYPENVQALFPYAMELKRLQVVSYMGTPLYTSAQELLGVLAVMDDKPMEQGELARSLLTIFAARAGAELERVRTDAALKDSEERYRYLVENSHELVAEIDADNRCLYISPNHRDILGYELTDLLHRDITDLAHPDDLPQILSKLDQPEGTAVLRYRHKDGSWRWLDAAGRRFMTPTGAERIVIVSRDITERKLAEEERQSLHKQLTLAQKMESIGRLAGGVAHDFNNLLTPILGFTEVLLHDLPPGDPRQELLLPILEAAERAKDLSHQLLVFSRKQELELKTVDLAAVIVRFQKLLRRTIREDIWITVRVAPSLGLVKADVGQIEQVLMNLSVNAQDAMPKGGLLSIELKNVDLDDRTVKHYPGTTPGSYVLLSVTDTGGGMNRDTLDHLFEPFYTTKTPGQGTGLGLSIVHGIVKQHCGIVCCVSEPGRGTTFKIYLPRLQADAIQASPDTPPPHKLKRGSETVLIVDDNQAVRDLASRILKHQGYQVIVAENTDHCLEIVDRQRKPINLLLTDIIMPVMNGRELYEHLHSVQPAMKVLYMSSYTDDIIARHGVSQKELSFIQKPFTIETLAEKVRNILDTAASHPQQ